MVNGFGLAIEAQRRRLYTYALRLCRNRDDAEDLVQETMFLALRSERQFKSGTNLIAWLITIMRNKRFTASRRFSLVVEDADDHHTLSMLSSEDQAAAYEARDALAHLADLPVTHSRALMMMADGVSVHDVAVREGVPEGTIKSRVHRGRAMFADLLGGAP